jgi:uncharacterized protein (DUF4415 family)
MIERVSDMSKVDPVMIDEDNPEWTAEMMQKALRFSGLPKSMQAKLRGRPKLAVTKERITIRLSRDVVDHFRASGDGWQTRMDEALKQWMEKNRAA